MSDVYLSKHLRNIELYGNLPQLFANVRDFHELMDENYNEIHAGRISEILLWIATNHPEVLKDDSRLLSPHSVTYLCFRDSYEKLDLIPTKALTTLLDSSICRRVDKFCGYIDPHILNMDSMKYLEIMKLAVGRDNIHLFSPKPLIMDEQYSFQEIVIHLLCREIDPDDLALFPILSIYDKQTIYISDVSDQDVDWVLQAATTLNRHRTQFLLKLISSKLTATEVEAIAKGLPELKKGRTWSLGVSSPHISQCVIKVFEYEESEDQYFDRISIMYNIRCFSFTDNEYEEEFLYECLDMDY